MSEELWIFGYGSLIWKVDFPIETKLHGYIKGFTRRFFQGSNDHRGTPEKLGRVVTLIPSDEFHKLPGHEHDIHKPDLDCVTWGTAYKIPDDEKEAVKAHLDFREKNGYSVFELAVYTLVDSEGHVDEAPELDPPKIGHDLQDGEKVTSDSTILLQDEKEHVYPGRREVVVVNKALVYIANSSNPSFLGPAPLEVIAAQIIDSKGPSGPNDEYLLELAKALRELPGGAEDDHVFELERLVLEMKSRLLS